MNENQIRNEVRRRIQSPVDGLARQLGIDPDTPPAEPAHRLSLPPREFQPRDEGPIIRGSLPFEVTNVCFGKAVTVDCRLRYILTLDEIPEARGRRGRSISRMMFAYDVLDWRDLDEFDPAAGEHKRLATPRWVPTVLEPLLHPQLLRDLHDRAELQAIETEKKIKKAKLHRRRSGGSRKATS